MFIPDEYGDPSMYHFLKLDQVMSILEIHAQTFYIHIATFLEGILTGKHVGTPTRGR